MNDVQDPGREPRSGEGGASSEGAPRRETTPTEPDRRPEGGGQRPPRPYRPILSALPLFAALVAAFALGMWAAQRNAGPPLPRTLVGEWGKLHEVRRLVNEAYVEEPDDSVMAEGAIEGLLKGLDPHSVYIPPREQTRVAERFEGEFSGIGIQFEIRDELLTVVSPIPGTPADRMGLRAGDRIVEIEGESAVGITNDEVFDRLRGPEGSQVMITVQRPGRENTFDLELTRGKIPIHSVESAFLLSDGVTGYIMISQFTAVTAEELEQALVGLEAQGMEQLVLDLRGNSGGYREMAREVADRFIDGGRIITTTRGRARGTSDTLRATGPPTRELPLVLLVSRGSASASEIVAGAVQDYDRGLILGQPTFGKGLVQVPFELGDGSVVRITISRWYTPAGRCVQRPWGESVAEYYMAAMDDEGIVADEDSLGPVFRTLTGRKVYGERGIHPDVVVDPGDLSEYGSALLRDRIVFTWANELADRLGRPAVDFETFLATWTLTPAQVQQLQEFAEQEGVPFDPEGWNRDRDYLVNQVKAEVAQRLYNGREYLWRVLIEGDAVVDSAVARMGDAAALHAKAEALSENG